MFAQEALPDGQNLPGSPQVAHPHNDLFLSFLHVAVAAGANPGRDPLPRDLNPSGPDDNSVWGRRDPNARVPCANYLVHDPISFVGFPWRTTATLVRGRVFTMLYHWKIF